MTRSGLTADDQKLRAEHLTADAKAVVKIVNKLRKKADIGSTSRISRGVPKHRRACPVAMTLQGTGIIGVDVSDFFVKDDKEQKRVPFARVLEPEEAKVLSRFVRHVDQGLYPNLEIPLREV